MSEEFQGYARSTYVPGEVKDFVPRKQGYRRDAEPAPKKAAETRIKDADGIKTCRVDPTHRVVTYKSTSGNMLYRCYTCQLAARRRRRDAKRATGVFKFPVYDGQYRVGTISGTFDVPRLESLPDKDIDILQSIIPVVSESVAAVIRRAVALLSGPENGE